MAKFTPYFPSILNSEGTAYENVPGDTGGCTHYGLILDDVKTFFHKPNATCDDVKALTQTDAFNMYKAMYWDKFHADDITNQSLATYIVDGAINQGVGLIAKYVQSIVGVTADGIVGPATVKAINAHDAQDLFDKLKEQRLKRYTSIVANNPSQQKFLKGWINRANCINFEA